MCIFNKTVKLFTTITVGIILFSSPVMGQDAFSDKEVCMAALTKMNQWSKNPKGGQSLQGRYLTYDNNKYYFKSKGGEWKCTILGDKVMWGLKSGRWRNTPDDGIINFEIVGNKLSITEKYSDNSSDVKMFTKKEVQHLF